MKKTFYFLGLLAVVSCSSVAQNTAVKESVTEATEVDIKKIVSFLASDDLQGRMSGSDGIAEAATFIENNFKANGVKPFFKTYKDTLSNFDSSKGVAYNVVGFVEGNDPKLKKEFIIIGAHYDHIGTAKADGDDVIANGANDNASGTAAVMEFARYFGKTKSNKRSIIFALFSAEEMGLLGSKHLAKKLKGDNLNLYTMLNFEMIGIPMQNKDYLAYLTGFNKSNLASVTNTYAGEKIAGFLPKAGDFRLFMRSDNYPFHNEFNVPSQTYSTFDFTNFDHYHKVGDEPSVMDFNHMASLINKFAPIIKSIANSDTKEIQYN
ncbi:MULTISPECIES: M28 family metallopeptidase [Cellulophaga]|uniref:Peptidase M28 n=2 Tax=Cellulophaga TaxID=104264 RepID=F0REB9_CELLC|nr:MULTISPECIES: M28 family peptidase [Cellulophaga]ADY29894.1 peptidase M28 [Cellulophaga lytica DSM 7489]AIM60894.1 peptidase M28 [Cellulophaga lytica]EWH15057.1 peptidase M28 [Cellulophaga geojensis KL-A]WQG75940.1 M20/M25/M40 family metallo-hydrolase [Cellulophaga lytica]